jgi:tape measure domain-containing protein
MLNLGGLFFTLNADTRGLMDAQRRIERFANDVRTAFRGVGKGTVDPAFAQSLNRQERAMVSAMEKVKRLQATVANANLTPRGAREAQVTMERLGSAFDNFTKKLSSGRISNLDYGRRVQHMGSQISDATRNIQRLVKEASVGPDPTPWNRMTSVLQGLGSASLVVQGHFGGFSTRFFGLTTLVREFGGVVALASAALAGLSAGVVLIGKQAITAGMAFQQLEKQFIAVTGSADASVGQLRFVRDVAQQAGLSFVDLGRGYARFLASAQSAGLTLTQTQDTFRGISLAAATMQLSVEDTQGVMRALDQMMSKGTVQAEELRGQLGDRLPGAFIIAANAMGVTTRELNKMLKAGEVVSAEFVPKFVQSLMTMYNIDPSKPIETLTASTARLGNEWLFLGQKINQSTGALSIATSLVDSLSGTLEFLRENMQQVVGVIGALIGALAGLAIAMAIPAIITLIGNMGIWIGLIVQSIRQVGLLATAVQVLNITMMANPIVRIIGIIGTLIAILAGAKLGYDLFAGAVDMSNKQMTASLDFTNSYIQKSKEMGAQVRATTNDLRQQTAELINNATAQLMSARATLKAQRDDYSFGTHLGNMAGTAWTNTKSLFGDTPSTDVRGTRLSEIDKAEKEISSLESQLSRATKSFLDLQSVAELPEMATNIAKVDDESKKAGKSLDSITNKIKDIIDASRVATMQFEALFAPLNAGESMEQRIRGFNDLGEALRIVNNLKPAEMGMAAKLLGVPNDVNAVTSAIEGLLRKTRQTTEATQEYMNLWRELSDGQTALKGLAQQLDYIRAQGGKALDPNQLTFLENLTEAQQKLRTLQESGDAGARALNKLREDLAAAGFASEDTATAWAMFNTQLEITGNQVQALTQVSNTMRDMKREVQGLMDLTAGISNAGGGGVLGGLFSADKIEAFVRAQERAKQTAEQIVIPLANAGIAQNEIAAAAERYLNFLAEMDSEQAVFDNLQAAAQRMQETMRSWVSDGLSGIKDFVSGVKSLEEAITDLGMSMLNSAWESFVAGPAEDWISNIGRSRGDAAAAGADSELVNNLINQLTGLGDAAAASGNAMGSTLINSVLGVVTGQVTQVSATTAATGTLTALAAAASAAAVALGAIVAAAAGGGDGSSSGLVGLIGNLAGVFAGSIGGATGIPAELIPPGMEGIYGGGAAMGGNMQAGKVYSVNEPGVNGEYFIPRVNGYMSPRSGGGGGGSNIFHIDASTTIDARGATKDAVQELRQEAGVREERLRRELPYIIDQRVNESANRGRL